MNILATTKGTIKVIGGAISKNSPAILTGLAVTGAVVTTFLTAKATIKAVKILEEEKDQNGDIGTKDLIRLTWKEYVPVAAALGLTIGCAIGAHNVSARRTAALAAGLASSNEALKAFKKAADDVVGEEKSDEIRGQATYDRFSGMRVGDTAKLPMLGNPEMICVDGMSGQPFMSNPEDIKKAVNEFNVDLIRTGRMSGNELLAYLNLRECDLGKYSSFDIDDGTLDYYLEYAKDDTDRPILVIEWKDIPRWRNL